MTKIQVNRLFIGGDWCELIVFNCLTRIIAGKIIRIEEIDLRSGQLGIDSPEPRQTLNECVKKSLVGFKRIHIFGLFDFPEYERASIKTNFF